MKKPFRYYWLIVKMGMYIVIPIALLLLPADYFDQGQSISLFELAGVKNYYSKGITRSIMHLIHLDFQTAWDYNKLSFVVLPLMMFVWVKSFWRDYRRLRRYRRNERVAASETTAADAPLQ